MERITRFRATAMLLFFATILGLFSVDDALHQGFLIFFGIMTTHGYSMGKNLLITICTIVAMIFIAFLIMLFSNLVSRMVSFVSEIITEISYRQF